MMFRALLPPCWLQAFPVSSVMPKLSDAQATRATQPAVLLAPSERGAFPLERLVTIEKALYSNDFIFKQSVYYDEVSASQSELALPAPLASTVLVAPCEIRLWKTDLVAPITHNSSSQHLCIDFYCCSSLQSTVALASFAPSLSLLPDDVAVLRAPPRRPSCF